MSSQKPHVLLMGQTPPPWHGQAVATQILFEHNWTDFVVHRLRMEYSVEMLDVGRFQWKKVAHLFRLILNARAIFKKHPKCILFYPPASAKWIPFLRDVIFLMSVRYLAGPTVLIFHASGLPSFAKHGILPRIMSRLAYHRPDFVLEVAQEKISAHDVFHAKSWQWCPCATEVPESHHRDYSISRPLSILFVASLQEGKGVLDILKTAIILKKNGRANDFHFRIVGRWFSENFKQQVHEMLADNELETIVELVGELTGSVKWDAYRQADLFFFPSHYESEATPLVLMEALGMGLPIISTEWAGIPAMLAGCRSARLLPINSPEKYAETFEQLSTDRDFLDSASHLSKAYYQKHFLPMRFIERVEIALRTVAYQ